MCCKATVFLPKDGRNAGQKIIDFLWLKNNFSTMKMIFHVCNELVMFTTSLLLL